MFTFKYLVVCLLFLAVSCRHQHKRNHESPIVETPLGKVQGFVLTSRLGNPVYSFTSMRYAKPPVGDLRFQPPVPIEKWDGVYDATKPGPVCPQANSVNTSEDCLMINVYANKLPSANESLDRPVILFIHPGGMYEFSGAIYTFAPDYLLDKDIVLVTFNYRLGTLGYLATGTKEAPGNNGFKDQVLAMKWVRDNVKAFGGNPNLVTLAGCSAGAISINLHLVSPMSKGLFHQVIMMSGSEAGTFYISTNQYSIAQKQARLVNCPDNSPAAIISCLKTKPAEEIGATRPLFAEVGVEPRIIWNAVIEPDFGQERFLVEHPVTSMINGRFPKIPMMLGVTEIEFGYASYDIILNQTYLDLLSYDYNRVLPITFIYERNTLRSRLRSTDLKLFYFGAGRLRNTTETRLEISDIYADGITGFAINRATKLFSALNKEQTYYYCFTYRGRYSYYYLPFSNGTKTAGAVHQDDLQYVFYLSTILPYIHRDDPEWSTVDKMVKIWSDFATTGNPTPDKSQLLNNVKWATYSRESPKYLEIGNKLVIKENLFERRYREWEKVFPLSEYE